MRGVARGDEREPAAEILSAAKDLMAKTKGHAAYSNVAFVI